MMIKLMMMMMMKWRIRLQSCMNNDNNVKAKIDIMLKNSMCNLCGN